MKQNRTNHDYLKLYNQYIIEDINSLRAFCKLYNLNYIVISRNFKKRNFKLKEVQREATYTKEFILNIHTDHYNNYLSFEELYNKYKISKQLLYRNFKRCSLPIHKNLNKSNVKEKGFLKNIDTALKAYYLGWMFSDGSVGKDLQLTIQARDIDILNLFKSNFGGLLYFQEKRKITHQDQYSLRITSQPDVDFIINHGCHRRKSFNGMKFPTLKSSLYRYFILGFFDGDGSIYESGRNKKIKFFSVDKLFLEELNKHLINAGCKDFYWNTNNKVHILLYGNKDAREKMMEYFYRDNPYFLKRKKEKFYKLVTPREIFDIKIKETCND